MEILDLKLNKTKNKIMTTTTLITDWDSLVKESEMVALVAHKNHLYDIFPYEKHFRDVVNILEKFGYINEFKCAGFLHDVIEDANLTYSKIKRVFGEKVAEMVLAVTDPIDVRNRKEKKIIVYEKLKKNKDAIIIKLADRIANTQHSLRMDNRDKISMYEKEYADFRYNLKFENHAEEMWAYLDEIMKFKKI